MTSRVLLEAGDQLARPRLRIPRGQSLAVVAQLLTQDPGVLRTEHRRTVRLDPLYAVVAV